MLYPSVQDLTIGGIGRYSLVVATAKLARQRAIEAEAIGEPTSDNGVRSAVQELDRGLKDGTIKIVEAKE